PPPRSLKWRYESSNTSSVATPSGPGVPMRRQTEPSNELSTGAPGSADEKKWLPWGSVPDASEKLRDPGPPLRHTFVGGLHWSVNLSLSFPLAVVAVIL